MRFARWFSDEAEGRRKEFTKTYSNMHNRRTVVRTHWMGLLSYAMRKYYNLTMFRVVEEVLNSAYYCLWNRGRATTSTICCWFDVNILYIHNAYIDILRNGEEEEEEARGGKRWARRTNTYTYIRSIYACVNEDRESTMFFKLEKQRVRSNVPLRRSTGNWAFSLLYAYTYDGRESASSFFKLLTISPKE